MAKRKIYYYNPDLKELARKNRNNMTLPEVKLWNYLKGKQMSGYDFHRQKPINNFICDFFCNKLSLCIEVDGLHHWTMAQMEADKRKEDILNSLEVLIYRIPASEILGNIEGVIAAIKLLIEEIENKK